MELLYAIQKFLGALLLLLVARILQLGLSIELFIAGVIITACNRKLAFYLYDLAVCIDVFGNVLGGPLWNVIFRRKGGYQFGSRFDTISFAMACNKRIGTLSKFGLFVEVLLNFFDKNHLEKTYRNFELNRFMLHGKEHIN